ncbi:hypothetical protein Pta02_50930 [Planobispora takensis]|uniref:Uncharacterized protein n=1 Tax=Planobispora takensis TaxID=1367882 RepID=A0A8J3WVH7_9ACTN|nr:hypothetical protein Pta02_50930 [Planobispora takensis]
MTLDGARRRSTFTPGSSWSILSRADELMGGALIPSGASCVGGILAIM